MLQGTGSYSVERWISEGVPLVTLRRSDIPGQLPAVAIYHSFAGKKTDALLRTAVPLTDAGYLAALPDAALHGDCAPEDFDLRLAQDPDGLYLESLRETVNEADDVLEWLASREDVDSERVGMLGTGMGGAVTLSTACRRDLRAAVVLMPAAGVEDPDSGYAPQPCALFPTALLMVHGKADQVAPYSEARRLYDEVVPNYSEAPERLRFVDMPGEEHQLSSHWIEETLAWFGRFL